MQKLHDSVWADANSISLQNGLNINARIDGYTQEFAD